MASVWYLVVVLFWLESVVARDCSRDAPSYKTCDECIRCGYRWCEKPGPNMAGMCYAFGDHACQITKAELHMETTEMESRNKLLNPDFWRQSVKIGTKAEMKIKSSIDISKVTYNITSRARSPSHIEFEFSNSTYCEGNFCSAKISVSPTVQFCPVDGQEDEIVTMSLVNEHSTIATAEYHVPCACKCSKNVQKNDPICNGRGDLSCGICTCNEYWTGDFCELPVERVKPLVPSFSGDSVPEKIPFDGFVPGRGGGLGKGCEDRLDTPLPCEGQRVCNEGRWTCQCDLEKEGSQYFNEECRDICSITVDYYDVCLTSTEPGRCQESVFRDKADKEALDVRDELDRRIWVQCYYPHERCNISFAAMKDGEVTHLMVLDVCSTSPDAFGGDVRRVNVTVPVVLGVLALVATAAAVAGYMMFKNRPPPMPSSDLQYTNIEAQDSTGVNPLYKPPTSFFQNPTYGKC